MGIKVQPVHLGDDKPSGPWYWTWRCQWCWPWRQNWFDFTIINISFEWERMMGQKYELSVMLLGVGFLFEYYGKKSETALIDRRLLRAFITESWEIEGERLDDDELGRHVGNAQSFLNEACRIFSLKTYRPSMRPDLISALSRYNTTIVGDPSLRIREGMNVYGYESIPVHYLWWHQRRFYAASDSH